MTRVIVFCEGLTEQLFVNKLLSIPLANEAVYLETIDLGGVTNYEAFKNQIQRRGRNHDYCTTMIDFFRMPINFPGWETSSSLNDPIEKAKHIEAKINEDIGIKNFFANITVHEIEGLLYSDLAKFDVICNDAVIKELEKDKRDYFNKYSQNSQTPEHINGGDQTSPSKRIIKAYRQYNKRNDFIKIAEAIGLETIERECRHFKEWVDRLRSFS